MSSQAKTAVEAVLPASVLVPAMSSEVQGYLADHPEMLASVHRGCRAAGERLGDRAQLSLELFRDPEADDQYLTLYVRQARYEPDLLDRIEDLTAQLHEEAPDAAESLLITTDFQPPR